MLVLKLRLVAVPLEVQSLIHQKLTEKLSYVSKIMHHKAIQEPKINANNSQDPLGH